MQTDPTRRRFLASGAATLSASWLAGQWPLVLQAAESASSNRREGRPLAHLQPAEADDLEAIAARIIPTTDTPGAREAGVIYFFDASIGGWMAGVENLLRPALAALNKTAATRFAGQPFHALAAEHQDALLREIEDGPFFQTVRMMTLAGMFALPAYGGNQDQLGWRLIGFDSRHFWQPPFGHYDAPFHPAADEEATAPSNGGHDHHDS